MKLKLRYSKRLLALCLSALFLVSVLPVEALAGTAAEYEIYQTENGGYLRINRFTRTLDRVLNVAGKVTIPRTAGSTTIEHIADGAFDGAEDVTAITVPTSVQTIGDGAFASCTSLRSVTLSEGLVSLGKDAFRYCYALENVNLPSSLTAIESNTFYSCLNLKMISIPTGVKSIGDHAFYDCKNLSSVFLDDGITSIGAYAFSGCKALVSLRLPSSLQDISTALFRGCTALDTVTVFGNVVTVGQLAFDGCSSLTKVILPDGVSRIDQLAFNGCGKLHTLSVPGSVSSISADAFYGCDNLTMYVEAATLAQLFASANRIPFVIGTLDNDDPGPGPDDNEYGETPFVDVKSHWAKEDIEWAYAKKYFNGVSDTRFLPEAAVNRGMLVSVLYRMEGSPAAGTSRFSDVPGDAYYAKAVAWAESTGVVSGVSADKFAPSRNITRQELAAMLYRYAQYKGLNTSSRGNLDQFNDTASIASYAGTAMAWAVGTGVITGVTSSTLGPKGNATRAQSVVMLRRFSKLS